MEQKNKDNQLKTNIESTNNLKNEVGIEMTWDVFKSLGFFRSEGQ